jgi:diadenosine tetraphosphate (Ap4A) HIT family hydrolase
MRIATHFAQVARAVHKVFNPAKVNYGAYGDTGCHLHMHIVPKYKDGDEWGGTFQMNPDKVYLTDEEYEAMAEQIRRAL